MYKILESIVGCGLLPYSSPFGSCSTIQPSNMSPAKITIHRLAVMLSISLVVSALAVPVTEGGLVLRDPGTVGEHIDPRALVERSIWSNVRFLYRSIFMLGLTRTVCSSPAAVHPVGAITCAVSDLATRADAQSCTKLTQILRNDLEITSRC